jgi:hypothetical protein
MKREYARGESQRKPAAAAGRTWEDFLAEESARKNVWTARAHAKVTLSRYVLKNL